MVIFKLSFTINITLSTHMLKKNQVVIEFSAFLKKKYLPNLWNLVGLSRCEKVSPLRLLECPGKLKFIYFMIFSSPFLQRYKYDITTGISMISQLVSSKRSENSCFSRR